MPADVAEQGGADAVDMRQLYWQWDAPIGPAPDSYNLYKGMAAGYEMLYHSGVTDLFYHDPEATPGSTYSCYVTSVTAGVESGPTNEVLLTVPADSASGNIMSETHIFSTGILTAQVGASAPITFGLLQDVSFECAYSRHDLWDAAINSVHAVDTADHEGKWTIKAGNAAILGSALQLLMASALTTATAPLVPAGAAGPGLPVTLNTVSGKIAFPILSVVLTLQDTTGHQITVTCTKAKGIGDSIAFKLTDFAMQNFELHCYPDPANSNIVAVVKYFN